MDRFLPPKELIEAYMKGDAVTQHKEPLTEEVLKDHFQKCGIVDDLTMQDWLRSVYCQLLG